MARLCNIDNKLSEVVVLQLPKREGKSAQVEFQFPPKLTMDNRSANWTEKEIVGMKELVILARFREREINLEWTYIVGGTSGWDVQKVKNNISKVKAYFDKVATEDIKKELAIRLKLWKIGGSDPMSFRAKSIDLTYGKAIIVPNGDVNKAYPLRTDVKLGMKAWTDLGEKLKFTKLGYAGLESQTLPGWY